jgi:hypothetical protein
MNVKWQRLQLPREGLRRLFEAISDGSEPYQPFVSGGPERGAVRPGVMPGGVFIRGRHVGWGNLWNYRSLSPKLCWRFEGALAGLGPGAVRTPVSGRPLPALTIEGQSRRL